MPNLAAEQLLVKYKHARHFCVTGPLNRANAQAYQAAIRIHVTAPTTRVISGTFRGRMAVVFYVDPATGLMVMTTPRGDFISGWRLKPPQATNVLALGRL